LGPFISYEESEVSGDALITLFGVNLFTILVSLTILYLLTNSQHNETQLNDTYHYETQHNDTQHNDTQHTSYLIEEFNSTDLALQLVLPDWGITGN
jgi:hypothetical protein